jgi:glycosyltransferase involved in cell wall biosynthesis
VVSTYEGAIPDVVDDGRTGMLVRQKDAIALADAIEKLICNPELRLELGENGYWKYKDKFALEKFESRLIEILSDIGKIEKNVR